MSLASKLAWISVLSLSMGCALDGDPTGSGNATEGDDGDSGDGTAADAGPVGNGATVTIYDLQQGNVPPMTTVRLENVVVTTPINVESGGVVVQDPMGGKFSGIYVYLYADVVAALTLAPGDIVNLTGEYSEFYDFSELTVQGVENVEVVGQGEVPAPLVVSPQALLPTSPEAEPYESVLVRLEDVQVTNADLGFGNFEVEGGVIVTNFFLFEQSAEVFPFESATFESLTGVLLYNFEEFKLAPRIPEDVPGAGGEPEGPVTIYEIQQGEVPVGAPVLVEDVVVTTPPTFEGDVFFVQERDGGERSGISIFMADPAGLQIQPGDVLTITGNYDEFYDESQIRVSSVADLQSAGSGDPLAPATVAVGDIASGQGAEAWEGVLVQVEGATVSTAANDYGEWEVDQALVVDDLFFDMGAGPEPAVGEAFASIAGVLTYSFETYKLAPRSASDLVAGG